MKVVSFLASLVLVGVGTWARVQYRSIQHEVHGNAPIEYGTLDQFFYDDGDAFSGDSCSLNFGGNEPSAYTPNQAVSSGVQANPFLD